MTECVLTGVFTIQAQHTTHSSTSRSQSPSHIGEAWLGDGDQICGSASPYTTPWIQCSTPPLQLNHKPHSAINMYLTSKSEKVKPVWLLLAKRCATFEKTRRNKSAASLSVTSGNTVWVYESNFKIHIMLNLTRWPLESNKKEKALCTSGRVWLVCQWQFLTPLIMRVFLSSTF